MCHTMAIFHTLSGHCHVAVRSGLLEQLMGVKCCAQRHVEAALVQDILL